METTSVMAESERVVLISGAGRGMGRLMALSFARLGNVVVAADLDIQNAREVQGEVESSGGRAHALEVDLSQPGAPVQMVRSAFDLHHRLDVLVNNARGGLRGGTARESEENWDLTMAVCCKAPFFASQEAIAVMKDRGAIVNISSISGEYVSGESASYHAAKAALIHLTRYLAVLGGPRGVRVNAVAPGFVVQDEHRERFQAESNREYRTHAELCQPLGRVGSSQEVVDAVVFLCSDAASFITGQTLGVDGGSTLRDSWTLVSAAAESSQDNERVT